MNPAIDLDCLAGATLDELEELFPPEPFIPWPAPQRRPKALPNAVLNANPTRSKTNATDSPR